MDLNALQVFNSMYRLGITDREFEAIEEEQKHTERTGLSIKCVKKGRCCICVSHDQKHQILIKRDVGGELRAVDNSRILFKTLIKFEDLPQEIYTLHRIAQYRVLDENVVYVATNLEELKDRICDRFADRYPKELGEASDYYRVWQDTDEDVKEMEKTRQELITEQLKALFWLFGEDYGSFRGEMARKNIPRIVKVFSRNNRRVAIFQINEKYERERGMWNKFLDRVDKTTLKLKTYTPRDERYNYVSPNREVFFGKAEIWINDDLFEKLEHAELEILSQRFDGEYVILNADKFNQMKQSIRLELMSAKRREQEQEVKEKLVRRIDEQFKGGRVVRQGIEFTRTSMSYGGVVFKADNLGAFIVSQNIIFQEQPNFTQIYQDYIDHILETDVRRNPYSDYDNVKTEICFEGKTKISIGKINITLFKHERNFFVKLEGRKPHRIGKEDVPAVLKSVIDYTNRPQEYEEYLSQTGGVNLKLQKALDEGGLKFELTVDKTDDNDLIKENYGKMLLTLPLTRRKGKNYVLIRGNEYKVKDTQALFDLGKESNRYYGQGGRLQRTIKLLYRGIGEITPEVIGRIISQGKREYAKMEARIRTEEKAKVNNSKEFLDNAIRLTNAQGVDGGYIVKGLSGSVYFVDEDGGVWTVREKDKKWVNDKYLCVIDVGTDKSTEWGKNDAIAKRLLALSKDSVVANEIYERGDKVDSFWSEIADGVGVV